MFTQVGVKQLTDFLRTVTAASDLVDCTLVNCANDFKMKFCLNMCISMEFNFNAFSEQKNFHITDFGSEMQKSTFLKKNVSTVQFLSN